MKLIARGAEAELYLDKDKVVKDRIKKDYRLDIIDQKLRKSRTKKEAKILRKIVDLGFTPKLIKTDDKSIIEMEHIKGEKVRDVLENVDYKKLSKEIAKKIKLLHDNGIVHGDLTTSNMILSNIGENGDSDSKVYLIDFGLSFHSTKVEDKAVDLHLLRQALESKHHTIWEECFEMIKKEYNDKEVLNRLDVVEKRGRNKTKH